ncbi:MAG: M15 family metallopeptidase [Steroidobacteraceae bacterium]
MNSRQLTGRDTGHVIRHPELGCLLHHETVVALGALRQAAAAAGIDLVPASAFRDFERQLTIWNDKFEGRRPLEDAEGRQVDSSGLDANARVDLILTWSALPGSSRHHWGSDFDLIDRAALPPGYRPRLHPEEYAQGGVFERLSSWLEEHAWTYGFFRPYRSGCGGVRPEPWHYSHAAVAVPALSALQVELLAEALEGSGLLGLEAVMPRLADIHRHWVATIDPPPG